MTSVSKVIQDHPMTMAFAVGGVLIASWVLNGGIFLQIVGFVVGGAVGFAVDSNRANRAA